MFSTFVTQGPSPDGSHAPTLKVTPQSQEPAPRRQKKRAQVARACDWCRVHRIKCDNDHPCSNCKNRGGQCSNSGAMKATTLPHAYREIERLKQQVQDLEAELQKAREVSKHVYPVHELNTPPSLAPSSTPSSPEAHERTTTVQKSKGNDHDDNRAKRLWDGIHISTARSPQKTWYGSSSLFYFIGRTNTFLTQALQQTHSTRRMIPNSVSNILDGPTTSAGTAGQPNLIQGPNEDLTAGDYLTPVQEEYFLGLFWQSFYTTSPILDELEFKEHYQSLWTSTDKERKPSALVDIVIAVCMQYGMALIPSSDRGYTAASRADVNPNDATIAGRWHYRRCLSLLSFELESPTISTLQCHILCSIYLCCGSFQNMADNACGLAVRTAYMLGLHLEPQGLPRREREMRKRLWWALYVLESKMSMKLGRPFLLHDYSTTCSLPADDRELAMIAGSGFAHLGGNVTWLTWNLHNTKLMLAARAAYTAFYNEGPDYSPEIFNERNGEPVTSRLEEWVKDVPSAIKTDRQNGGLPLSTDLSPLDIEKFAPLWVQRQRLLLELMYHNLGTNLYRPAITFPSPSHQIRGPDHAARKCAAHAMALTHIMHQVLSTTSILAGWHEAFQWQWNCAMTLVGFVLAYPQGPTTPAARAAIDLSITVFETFGNSFAVAASAANIMSDLTNKIDFLASQDQISALGPDTLLGLTDLKKPEDQFQLAQPGIIGDENGQFNMMNMEGLNFADENTVEITGVLAQSIDIFAGETYNDFDWSSINNNFNDQWTFAQ